MDSSLTKAAKDAEIDGLIFPLGIFAPVPKRIPVQKIVVAVEENVLARKSLIIVVSDVPRKYANSYEPTLGLYAIHISRLIHLLP